MTETTIKVKGDVKNAQKEFRKLSAKIEDVGSAAKKGVKRAGIAFAGLTAGIALSSRSFGKFEKDMKGVKTLLDSTSFEKTGKSLEKGFKNLTDQTLKVFSEMPIKLDAASKAMFDLVSAGIPASEATKTLATASKLAVAGLTDVSTATDGLTSVINAYGLEAQDAEKVAGKFFLAQKAGKTTIEELSSGFGNVGATAQALGVSFEEVLASVSAMTLGGVKTAEAYTSVNAVLAGVAKPTAEATEEAKRLGVEFSQAALSSKGLSGFLSELTNNSKFSKDSVTKLFGSVEAMKAVFALTGTQADKFGDILKDLENDTKAVQTITAAYEETLKSQDSQIQLTKNAFNKLAIEIGAKVSPLVVGLSKMVRELINWFGGLSDETKTIGSYMLIAATAITGVVTAVATFLAVVPSIVAGFTMVTAAVTKMNLAFLANPIVAAVAAIVAAITGLYVSWKTNFLGIQEIAFGVFGAIKTFFSEFIDNVSQMFGGLGEILVGVFTLDTDKVKAGLAKAMDAVSKQISATAKAYQVAHDKRLEQIKKETDERVGGEKKVAKIAAQSAGAGFAITSGSGVPKAPGPQAPTAGQKAALKKSIEDAAKANAKAEEEARKRSVSLTNQGLNVGSQMLGGRAGATSLVSGAAGMAADVFMPGIGGAVSGLVKTLAEQGPEGAKKMISEFMEAIPDIIVTVVEALIASVDVIVEKLITVFLVEGGLERIVMAIIRNIPKIAEALVMSTVRGLNNALVALAERFGIKTIDSMSLNMDKIVEPLRKFFDSYTKFLTDLFSKVTGFFKGYFNGVSSFFNGFTDKISTYFNKFIGSMTDLFNWLPEAIRKAVSPGGGGGAGFAGIGKAIGNTGDLGNIGKDFVKTVTNVKGPKLSLADGRAPQYLAKGWTPKWPDTELAWIDPRERIMSNADNKTVISGINSILSKVSGGQNINLSLTFRGDGIQELIQKSLVEASALGTGRIQVAVGSES